MSIFKPLIFRGKLLVSGRVPTCDLSSQTSWETIDEPKHVEWGKESVTFPRLRKTQIIHSICHNYAGFFGTHRSQLVKTGSHSKTLLVDSIESQVTCVCVCVSSGKQKPWSMFVAEKKQPFPVWDWHQFSMRRFTLSHLLVYLILLVGFPNAIEAHHQTKKLCK